MIHIAIIDDEKRFRNSLSLWLKTRIEVILEGSFGSIDEVLEQKENLKSLDMILLDIELEGANGIAHIQVLKKTFPDIKVIILSSHSTDDHVISALRAGADSYCLKGGGSDSLWQAIMQTWEKGSYLDPSVTRKVIGFFSNFAENKQVSGLTKRELEVVIGIVDGLSYKLIANRLGVTVHTVNHFVRIIYKKLGVNSKAEVIRMAYRGDIVGITI
ncbi:MAG: response regulator transcription factor [Bacteroidia bacterium]